MARGETVHREELHQLQCSFGRLIDVTLCDLAKAM